MDRGDRLVPGVPCYLGDALEYANGRIENGVELIKILERRCLHGDDESRRQDLFCWKGETRNLSFRISVWAYMDTWLDGI